MKQSIYIICESLSYLKWNRGLPLIYLPRLGRKKTFLKFSVFPIFSIRCFLHFLLSPIHFYIFSCAFRSGKRSAQIFKSIELSINSNKWWREVFLRARKWQQFIFAKAFLNRISGIFSLWGWVVGDGSFTIVFYYLDTILMPGIYNKEANYSNWTFRIKLDLE